MPEQNDSTNNENTQATPLNFKQFITWEAASRDVIDFKKSYCDVAGGVLEGLVLSEIIYWYLPDKRGNQTKLSVTRDGYDWIACKREDWWDRTRMTPRQVDLVMAKLVDAGIVMTSVYKFGGTKMLHVRLVPEIFLWRLSWVMNEDAMAFYPTSKPRGKAAVTEQTEPLPTPDKKPSNPISQISEIENGGPYFTDQGNSSFHRSVKSLYTETTASSNRFTADKSDGANGPKKATPKPDAKKPVSSIKAPEDLTDHEKMVRALARVFIKGSENLSHEQFELLLQGRLDGWKKPTSTEYGEWGKASSLLRQDGYTPEDIPAIYRYCKANFDRFGPGAIAKNARLGVEQFGKGGNHNVPRGIRFNHLPDLDQE